jgi:hypothetical protein
MKKEKNARGVRTRKTWTQTIIESALRKDRTVNRNAGRQKKIIHKTIFKSTL